MVEVTCVLGQEKARFTVSPVNASGGPASLDGNVEAVVESGDGTAEPGNGPTDCVVRPGSTVGDIVGFLRGDADKSAGVRFLNEPFVVHVVEAEAASLGATGSAEPL